MKPELANVIAHIQGDGCVNYRKNGRIDLNYCNQEEKLIEDFRNNFKRHFGVDAWRPSFRETAILTGTGKAEIVERLVRYQLKDWRTPKEIYGGTDEIKKVYLRALFDDDGTVTLTECKAKNKDGTLRKFWSRKIKLYSKNLIGLQDVQELLSIMKIKSFISKPRTRDIHELNISGIDSILKFSKSVGFLHPRKIVKLEEVVSSCPSM